jgi:transcriptional regulator with XRE-family HTH domain
MTVPDLNEQGLAELGVNGDLEALGTRLRVLRKRHGMTLKDVASQTKIGPSMVSQLERGLAAPSLATLYSLAQLYKTGLAELFQPNDVVENEVVRRDERTVVHLPRSNAVYELLGRARQDLQMFEMVMTADAGHTYHTIRHAGEECVLVLEGKIRATVGTRDFELDQGDSLQYSATLPHTYEVRKGKSARLIVAITPPVL